MATLDQERAKLAFAHVGVVKGWNDEARQKKYASIVHGMPALLRSAGLSQALHFVFSRRNDDQTLFLDHLAKQLFRVTPGITERHTLLAEVRGADLTRYLGLTREALACVDWYRRFVQGVLGIEQGDANAREE